MKTIIDKIEFVNDKVQFVSVGYTTNNELIEEINENYDITLGKFSAENRTKLENEEILISEFFENISFVYEARKESDNIDGFNLNLVNSIDELE